MDLIISPSNTTSTISRALSSCVLRQLLNPTVASRFASTTCRLKPRAIHHIRPQWRPSTQPRQRRTAYSAGLAFVAVPACALAVDSVSPTAPSASSESSLYPPVDEYGRSQTHKSMSRSERQLPHIMRQSYQSHLADVMLYEAPRRRRIPWVQNGLRSLAWWLVKKVLLNVIIDGSIVYWVYFMNEKEEEQKAADEMRWRAENARVWLPKIPGRHTMESHNKSKVEVR